MYLIYECLFICKDFKKEKGNFEVREVLKVGERIKYSYVFFLFINYWIYYWKYNKYII